MIKEPHYALGVAPIILAFVERTRYLVQPSTSALNLEPLDRQSSNNKLGPERTAVNMAERPKVNLNALSELKNTTDDMIAPYLKSLGFKQSHTLTDVRLAFGFTACTIAGLTFYYDWTAGFEAAKFWTFYAVVAYFILNTALTFWMMFVEGGKVYVGEKDGVTITLSSHTEKHSPFYHLKVVTSKPGIAPLTAKEKISFTNWFDQKGYFVEKPFKAFLQSTIPALATRTPEAIALKSAKKSAKEA